MNLKRFRKPKLIRRLLVLISIVIIVVGFSGIYLGAKNTYQKIDSLQIQSLELGKENENLKKDLASNLDALQKLQSEDQYVINKDLKQRINDIEKTYSKAVSVYEQLLSLKDVTDKTSEYDDAFTKALTLLSKQSYADADSALSQLSSDISSKREQITASFTIPKTVAVNNDAPTSGYSYQQVKTDIGNYLVSIVAADLSSTKVIVDTASSSDCHNDCPVLSLGEYASRNNAYAGINGSYFCPAAYPSCAGKTNSFDTLLMNKDKTYFNSDNNVYSNIPAAIFGGSYIRFVGQSSEWGRDTGIDSMIANQNMLVQGGNDAFVADGDPKKGVKSGRSFVGNKGNTVYIGVVHNATLAEAAIVLHTMVLDNAMSLDSGGSTALWSGGYKVGPGRNIPNAILFIRK